MQAVETVKKKIRFIINPISGLGRKNQLPDLIEQHLDHSAFDYEITITEYRKHAKKIAQDSVKEGYDIVCAIGGDGSVHEVGTGLIGSSTRLAIIPAGSGNGLARHLKIPLNVVDAIHCINEFHTECMDTVLVNDKPFLGIGGYGFDALIAKKFDEYHARGFWSYIKLVTRELFTFKPVNVTIEMPNFKHTDRVVLCTLANASEFGNGFCVSPNSAISDGEIELCILKPFSIWQAPNVAFKFFRKEAHLLKNVEIIQVKKARITLENQIAHYDGEPFEVRKELNIEVIPSSLNILVGKLYA